MPGIITITGAGGFLGGHVTRRALRALPADRLRLVTHRTPVVLTPDPAPRPGPPLGAPPGGHAPGAARPDTAAARAAASRPGRGPGRGTGRGAGGGPAGTATAWPPGAFPDRGEPGPETVPGDLTDPASLRGACSDSEVLIHCASQIGGPDQLCEAVNARGTEALLAEARRAGVRRIVYLSTAAVYGPGPFHDARPEDLPLAPRSATSATRAEAERAVLEAGGIVLRPHLVYGTGDRWIGPGLVRLLRALDADVAGWPARVSMIEADDLARAVLGVALAPGDGPPATVYHASHPRPVPVAALLDAVGSAAGVRPPSRSLTAEQARERLRGQGRATHDLDMLTVEHTFDSAPLWHDLGLPPGPGFPDRFAPHAAWYRDIARTA